MFTFTTSNTSLPVDSPPTPLMHMGSVRWDLRFNSVASEREMIDIIPPVSRSTCLVQYLRVKQLQLVSHEVVAVPECWSSFGIFVPPNLLLTAPSNTRFIIGDHIHYDLIPHCHGHMSKSYAFLGRTTP
uniref:Uncharacterized protein n=1 Tax=Pristionchus pacificus TaxID=54126 RepID=A0A2A6B2M7_PRIPA|eukprot:PDM60122.1 hypothetical protein PRIPAC_49408 [Pristionchus pacificus]